MQHSIYGLSILSSRPLPGVPECGGTREPSIHVTFGCLPDQIHSGPEDSPIFPRAAFKACTTRPSLLARKLADSGDFWLTYEDGTQFVIDGRGTRVWARWPDPLTLEDTATYFLGPVLGFLLRLRGVLCLHASAVEIDGEAVAIVGPPGAGKSTLAAGFAEAGFAVLSDDVASLAREGSRFMVQPGYPRLRLWPDSVRALYGSAEAFPRITPTWDKRHLDLTEARYRFLDRPAPLGTIYLLDERASDARAPSIEGMKPRDILMALVANTYATYLLDGEMRATEFRQLEQLASAVPIRRVTPGADARHIPDLRRSIVQDFRTRGRRV